MIINLKILTLNCWGVPFAKDKQHRIALLAGALAKSDYDVVCLQEIWELKDLQTIIKNSGFTHHHHYPSGVIGSGLVILSQHPLIQTAFYRYSLGGAPEKVWQGDFMAGKGIALARVQTPTGEVDVFNTHTVAQYRPDDRDEHRAHRAAQMYEATQFIKLHNTTNPAVICGDFNMQPYQPIYHMFKALVGARDCYTELHDDEGITYAPENLYNEGQLSQRLDYVFTRMGRHLALTPLSATVTMTRTHDIDYSDHYGVAVEFTASPADDPEASDLQPIYADLRAVIAYGLQDTWQRQQRHRQHVWGSLLVFAGIRRSPVLFYTFMRFLFGYIIAPSERNSFKAILGELETEL